MVCLSVAGQTPALTYAVKELKEQLPFVSLYDSRMTHLLLPVPSMDGNGLIKGGEDLVQLLKNLPLSVTLIGGNLPEWVREQHPVMDFLKDPIYMAQNANITANCALKHILNHCPYMMADARILILGFGRIGKCLARLLSAMGAQVTVCARKETDLAAAASFGYGICSYDEAPTISSHVIVNTVPAMVMPHPPEGPFLLDLASVLGIGGNNVLWARFLPGKDAPASSGKLIADTVLRRIKEDAP